MKQVFLAICNFLSGFMLDDQGNPSSMRLMTMFLVVVITYAWYFNVMQHGWIPFPWQDIGVLIGGKTLQKHIENRLQV